MKRSVKDETSAVNLKAAGDVIIVGKVLNDVFDNVGPPKNLIRCGWEEWSPVHPRSRLLETIKQNDNVKWKQYCQHQVSMAK